MKGKKKTKEKNIFHFSDWLNDTWRQLGRDKCVFCTISRSRKKILKYRTVGIIYQNENVHFINIVSNPFSQNLFLNILKKKST